MNIKKCLLLLLTIICLSIPCSAFAAPASAIKAETALADVAFVQKQAEKEKIEKELYDELIPWIVSIYVEEEGAQLTADDVNYISISEPIPVVTLEAKASLAKSTGDIAKKIEPTGAYHYIVYIREEAIGSINIYNDGSTPELSFMGDSNYAEDTDSIIKAVRSEETCLMLFQDQMYAISTDGKVASIDDKDNVKIKSFDSFTSDLLSDLKLQSETIDQVDHANPMGGSAGKYNQIRTTISEILYKIYPKYVLSVN